MFKFTKSKQQGTVAGGVVKQRLLNVEVIEAKNLLAAEKKKGSSDPYCICQLTDIGLVNATLKILPCSITQFVTGIAQSSQKCSTLSRREVR
jgi:hypothetical protein